MMSHFKAIARALLGLLRKLSCSSVQLLLRFWRFLANILSSRSSDLQIPPKCDSSTQNGGKSFIAASGLPFHRQETYFPVTGSPSNSKDRSPRSPTLNDLSSEPGEGLQLETHGRVSRSQYRSETITSILSPTSTIFDSPGHRSSTLPSTPKISPSESVRKNTSKYHVMPMRPCDSTRYDVRPKITGSSITIPPGPASPNRGVARSLPDDWTRHIHPEGLSYFVKVERTEQTIYIITECDIASDNLWEAVESVAEIIIRTSVDDGWLCQLRTSVLELVIMKKGDDPKDFGYYFVNPQEQNVFWLESIESDQFGVVDVCGSDHLGVKLQEYYWVHREFFPCHHQDLKVSDPEQDLIKLMATLTHNLIDLETCPTSTVPFERNMIQTMLGALKALKHERADPAARDCVVARIWKQIYEGRYINYYGLSTARLFRSQMTEEELNPSPNLFMKLVFVLLLNAPSTHLTTFREVYNDSVFYTEGWRKLIDLLMKDWQDLILLATVLLTANMGFMAIFNSPEDIAADNLAITCSLVSTFCSTVSIVIGLLHIRRHRLYALYASDAEWYFRNMERNEFNLRPLAVSYSLPYAFLLWAVGFFIAAILLYVYQTRLNFISRCIVSVLIVVLAAICGWVVMFFWKDGISSNGSFAQLFS